MPKVERAIIMAAGLGNRMHPVTLTTPKPLVKVNGVRMIDTVIDGLHKNGINAILSQIRFFFGDTFGTYYLVIGLGIFILSLYIAGSKYGNIVLGEQNEKPKYSFFAWGSMMFTCGLAADILFYSLCHVSCKLNLMIIHMLIELMLTRHNDGRFSNL